MDRPPTDRISHFTQGRRWTPRANYRITAEFVAAYGLYDKKCLEIGSSIGSLQDMVVDYTGMDIVDGLKRHYHKPYLTIEADGAYPVPSKTYDAVWTINTFEHIQDIDFALSETKRILKPGGVLLFSPAWQCRPWAYKNLSVKSYKQLAIGDKIIKAAIPLRTSILWRSIFIFPKRLKRHLLFRAGAKPRLLAYAKLTPNWAEVLESDADACNGIDPHDAILWFEGNGFRCLSHPMDIRAFFVRGGPLVFKKE